MKISKKAWVSTVVAGAVALGLGMASQANAEYKATFYVAGMGGHFAKAETVVNPSAAQPIQLHGLSKIDIGSRPDHPTHDPRIDSNNKNQMFWSTYKIDKEAGGPHVGKTDLNTGEIIKDVVVPVPKDAKKTGSLYCASGQSATSYMPISMANPGYIDVFNKADMSHTRRITLEGTAADIGKPYKFYHGVNSPDGKRMMITVNEADKPHGKTIGKVHILDLDLAEFEKGNMKVNQKTILPGAEGKTISFRMTFSPDGSLLAASGADRLWILDGKTLEIKDTIMAQNLEQNHDAMFTPDGKYVVATMRTKQPGPECEDPTKPKEGEFTMDGQLKLYEVAAKKWVGKPTSVCLACHTNEGIEEHAILCGLDGTFSSM